MVRDNDTCALSNLFAQIPSIAVDNGRCGMVKGYTITSNDKSLKSSNEAVYGAILPATHHGLMYLDTLFSKMHFPPSVPLMITLLKSTSVLNALDDHAVPQDSRQAMWLPDYEQSIATEHDELQCIAANEKIGCSAPSFLNGGVAIATMFVYTI